jgi:hypothetical protein
MFGDCFPQGMARASERRLPAARSVPPSTDRFFTWTREIAATVMSESKPIPFRCPSCGAEYNIVAVKTAPDAQRGEGKIGCLKCDALFPALEGRTYYLVGRPGGHFIKGKED